VFRLVFDIAPELMECIYCKGSCIRKGWYKTTQRYQCQSCKRYQQLIYQRRRYDEDALNNNIKLLHNEGMGISSISRYLQIAKSTVCARIVKLSALVHEPLLNETGQVYEVDELRTYVGNKRNECWVMYAINRSTKQVVTLVTGKRTKANIKLVADKILSLQPKRIYTDGLNIYPALIEKQLHRVFEYCTNKIERMNLTLRTHLKRLSRSTICFSKSEAMLAASTRLYVWK
jgi:insertion element IS1 protein InsB